MRITSKLNKLEVLRIQMMTLILKNYALLISRDRITLNM